MSYATQMDLEDGEDEQPGGAQFGPNQRALVEPPPPQQAQLQRLFGAHFRRPASPAATIQRRDDLDDELDDDDDADQSAAASYQNEDNDGGGGAHGQRDGYGENDPEPESAYEETPIEQEGQADLERFFDDHLGASDRDGMDKENLPSNLVRHWRPGAPMNEQAGRRRRQLVASASSSAPTIVGRDATSAAAAAAAAGPGQLERAAQTERPTRVEMTRYVRLPNSARKLIITHQVTRQGQGRAPSRPLRDPEAQPLLDNGGSGGGGGDNRRRATTEPLEAASEGATGDDDDMELYGWEPRARRLAAAARAAATAEHKDGGAPRASGGNDAAASAIQLTEDEDFERVFVTNATNRPFKIAALGGYDPEQDFREAAADIESLERGRVARASAAPDDDELGKRAGGDDDDDDDGESESAPAGALADAPGVHLALDDAAAASEPDEVTFGQDEPYQTDLEAEMRQQQFDKVGQFLGGAQAPTSASSATSHAAEQATARLYAPSGERAHRRATVAPGEGETAPPPPPPQPGLESRAAKFKRRARPDSLELDSDLYEGSWVNDGVEDMEIPSQSHQDMILAKAAKQADEAAAAAAAAAPTEAENDESNGGATEPTPKRRQESPRDLHEGAEEALDEDDKEDALGGEKRRKELARRKTPGESQRGRAPSSSNLQERAPRHDQVGANVSSDLEDEDGPSNRSRERGQRMKNANYMKNDVADDDSGY